LVLGNPPSPPRGSIRQGSMPNMVYRPKPEDNKEPSPATDEAESTK
jgi:hypothetical protein